MPSAICSQRLRHHYSFSASRTYRYLIDAGFAVQTARHTHEVVNRVFKHALRTGHFHGPLPTVGVKFPYMARWVLSVLKRPRKEMAYLSIATS
jgi:hypothetical protein